MSTLLRLATVIFLVGAGFFVTLLVTGCATTLSECSNKCRFGMLKEYQNESAICRCVAVGRF